MYSHNPRLIAVISYITWIGWIAAVVLHNKGDRYEENGFSVSGLWPVRGADLSGNDASMVLMLEAGGSRMLFTGDISEETEQLLSGALQCDILKAPHHGSSYSSSVSFLQKTQAETVLISYGRNNTYGHPGKDTLSRYRSAGMQILGTGAQGAVRLLLRDGRIVERECFGEGKQ